VKNLIPYNLFEMSKISVEEEIEKMSEVLEYIFNYDYMDLIKEIYGNDIEDNFIVRSKPQLEFGIGHEYQNKKIDRESFKKILCDIFDMGDELSAAEYEGIIEILLIQNKKNNKNTVISKHYVLYVRNATRLFLIEPFTDVHENEIKLDSYKSTERIFKEFYNILKTDMKNNA
jgi:GMP synthase PP-ATPase subunit